MLPPHPINRELILAEHARRLDGARSRGRRPPGGSPVVALRLRLGAALVSAGVALAGCELAGRELLAGRDLAARGRRRTVRPVGTPR